MERAELEKMPQFSTEPSAAWENYQARGYHIERNVWTDAELRTVEEHSKGLPTFVDGTYAPAMNPHRVDRFFLDALKQPQVVALMARLVGGRVSGLQTEFFHCPPGTPGFTAHQDNFYVQADPALFASAWTALQDVSTDMGSLYGFVGSHKEPILPTEPVDAPKAKSQDPNANRQQAVMANKYARVNLAVPKGGVVLIHANFVHGSNPNTSQKFRRALLNTYIRAGAKFRPGFSAKREEIPL